MTIPLNSITEYQMQNPLVTMKRLQQRFDIISNFFKNIFNFFIFNLTTF